ncbi:hypothetical protein N8K70_03820 [Microbacterium betulae]|uniref:Helix-turn-helix domain-containing protein n=1 Tax=Microbacterium betulae TaxID=2981139 RepID=A0AA97FIZ4_9MICO|nr:hypothetical protein [Microbacterium sp. AB]WOF23818.1 hypothetical protein N8K70_03820 [Microbacterium sp. AB]
MTSERYCARGCTIRGEHFAACPDYGNADGTCRGCVPVEARDGALICERCYRAIRGCLEDAADVVGHLRSIADPTRSSWNFDRLVLSGRIELPAPVQASIIDASDDIVKALRAWALYVQFGYGHPWRAQGLEAGADAASSHEDAAACADLILTDLDRIANNHDAALGLHADIAARTPGDPDRWTVADALARFPLDDQPRTAEQPCPECARLTVHVQPPRRGGNDTRYLCRSCGWVANSADDGGLWAHVFRDEIEREEPTPHDPGWLTLADAARLAHRTPATIRHWADKGIVTKRDGRYRRDDITTHLEGTAA